MSGISAFIFGSGSTSKTKQEDASKQSEQSEKKVNEKTLFAKAKKLAWSGLSKAGNTYVFVTGDAWKNRPVWSDEKANVPDGNALSDEDVTEVTGVSPKEPVRFQCVRNFFSTGAKVAWFAVKCLAWGTLGQVGYTVKNVGVGIKNRSVSIYKNMTWKKGIATIAVAGSLIAGAYFAAPYVYPAVAALI